MKECSLNHYTQSLAPWLNKNYIRLIRLDDDGRVVFYFYDGVIDSYEITDCDRVQLKAVIKDLQEKGIPVKGDGYPIVGNS